ncbi:MAG TPA: hypothetical protein VJA21_08855 [Verrucomicrobiae bacterium]
MRLGFKCPWLLLGIVVLWRLLVLIGTAQPVPGNDAFLFDGAVVNWLLHGQYFNPSLAECFPINGREIFAAYPPIYQGLLSLWMWFFGTSAGAAMWFHFVCFGVAGLVLAQALRLAFPKRPEVSVALLFLFAVTFDDRPEGLAHVFGLLALLLSVADIQMKVNRAVTQSAIVLALFCSLYTSLIVGGFYFGITVLFGGLGWLAGRRRLPWAVAIGVVALFTGVTVGVALVRPLWWQGFLENARQTPVSTTGFRFPQAAEVIKIIRNAPVFLLALACAPWLWWKQPGSDARPLTVEGGDRAWTAGGLQVTGCPSWWLATAIAASGLALVIGALTLFTANYVIYLWYAQALLAAGLLERAANLPPWRRRLLQAALAGCLVLVSVRAVGMTTWGALCASDVNYARARSIVRQELQPFANSEARPVVSSAFLYEAAALNVRRAIHADWPYDRRQPTTGGDLALMNRLRPPKLVLTQFDFYRVYAPIVEEFRRHPELCSVNVRNTATVPTPDSFPSLQRVLQHISWAPIVVEFSWRP